MSESDQFRSFREEVDALLRRPDGRSETNIDRIKRLLAEMTAIATASAVTPYPQKLSLPNRPPVSAPALPPLPKTTEYYIAEREMEKRLREYESEISHPDSRKKGWMKRVKRAIAAKHTLQAEMPGKLERIQIDMLSESDRSAYARIIAERARAGAALLDWENAVARIEAKHQELLVRWEFDGRNQRAATRFKIIERLRLDLAALSKGMLPTEVPVTRVPWRMLPTPLPGEAGLSRLLAEITQACPKLKFDRNRLESAYQLGPRQIYIGSGEFDGYLAFEFNGTDRILLECPVSGNAAYIFRRDWRTLSRLSKTELLRSHSAEVSKVVHTEGGAWQTRIKYQLRIR